MTQQRTPVSLESSGLDTLPFPEKLVGHVVSPTEPRRIHGYDAEADLAASSSHAELLLLLFTGELPSPAAARALDVAMTFVAPVLIVEAPAHAATIARLCECPTAAVVGTAAIATAERARFILEEHASLLAWLSSPTGAPPGAFLGTENDQGSVQRLRDALDHTGLRVPGLAHPLTRTAAMLAVLHACGLRDAARMEIVLVLAQMPAALAEALHHKPGAFKDYPTNLPRFRYVERT